MKYKSAKKKGFTTVEFLVVALILIIAFIVFVDMSLYFRAPYHLQSFNDALFNKLQSSYTCRNTDDSFENDVLGVTKKYFGSNFQYSSHERYNVDDTIVHVLSNDKIYVAIVCVGDIAGQLLVNQYYSGLLIYKNKFFSSTPSIKNEPYY